MTLTNLPHNSDCFRRYLVNIDKVTRRVYPFVSRRGRWDCPGCAVYKFGKMTAHLPLAHDTLCWGLWSDAIYRQSKRRGLGWFTMGLDGEPKIMVAESHLYSNQAPATQILHEVLDHISTRTVVRMGWSDKWRPPKDGDPTRYEIIDSDCDDLARVQRAIAQAGYLDGTYTGSADEVKARIELLLNGVGFKPS